MYICELLFVQLECFDCCGVVDDVKPKLKFTEGCEGVKPIKKKPSDYVGDMDVAEHNIILCSWSITSLSCRCF